jgi:hypothetical protein
VKLGILEILVIFVIHGTLVNLERLGDIKIEYKARLRQTTISKTPQIHVRAVERVTDMRLGVTQP